MSALATVRAIHYIAIAQAFGALVFSLAIANADSPYLERRVQSIVRWSAVIALASWLGWLASAVPAMTGTPIGEALAPPTVARIIEQTSFGRAWLARLALLVALVVLVALLRRARGGRILEPLAIFVAAVAIASLAEVGHAVAATATQRPIHIASDALHLVAAGAWLGALVPFAIALHATSQPAQLRALARRFSVVGIACVVLLIASGVVNAVYLVASWPALFGTVYGQLLVAKIALFAAMLVLAGWNLLRGTPQLAHGDATRAATHIARNARAEAAFGVGVLAIVGVLGIAVPAAHDAIRWPFGFRIAFDGALPSIVTAYPTTYAQPPRYTVSSIARGNAVYAANCAACHDTGGAPTLRAAHVLDHRAGEIYWWITHGIAGTEMPAFGDRLDERARWDVVQFARTLASASTVRESTAPGIVAPQFTYQIDRRPQQLVGPNAPAATLLVLYTMPESSDRLAKLATSLADFARAGIRVAAVAMRADHVDNNLANIIATASPEVADVYRLFAPDVAHVEFLIDRDGWLRARWLPGALAEPADVAQQYRSLPAASAAPIAHEHDR